MIKTYLVSKHVLGLNSKDDPAVLISNQGDTALAVAVNVRITRQGLLEQRQGYEVKRPGTYHSLFVHRDAYCIKEEASSGSIFRIAADFSEQGIRANLTKDARMDWAKVDKAVFYCNGYQNGFILDGASFPWPVGIYNGPDTSEAFTQMPVGTHLAHRNGIIGVSVGDSVYFNNLPFSYGLVSPRRGHFRFSSRVLMIVACDAGFFVSDEHSMYLLIGNTPDDFELKKLESGPAVEWSNTHSTFDGTVLKKLNVQGACSAWLSTKGICVGLPDGSVRNLTEAYVDVPIKLAGATVISPSNTLICSA